MNQKIEKRPYMELYSGSRRSEEYGGKQAFMVKSDKGKPLPLVLLFNSSFNCISIGLYENHI